MRAWHFIRASKRLGYGDDRTVIVGETLTMLVTKDAIHNQQNSHYNPSIPTLCKSGMHGSVRVTDALKYAPGLTLCEVEIDGDIQEGGDKIVGRTRRVLRMVDATQVIVRFAFICADRAKDHAESAAESAAKYAAEYAKSAASAAKYAAKYAAEYAKSAESAAESAECAAEYAKSAAKYAKYAAEYAAKSAESERGEQEKILISLIEEAFAAQEATP